MKRITKSIKSRIVEQRLQYPKDKQSIRMILEEEQSYFCAYTEEPLTATTSIDVEHFDPTRKYTMQEDYNNWFAVIHKWNQKKGSTKRWNKFQPILHPTAADLEQRVFLRGVYYELADIQDIEAENLRKLICLNEPTLVKKRQSYLLQLKTYEQKHGRDALFEMLLDCKDFIKYPTLIETHFGFFFPTKTL